MSELSNIIILYYKSDDILKITDPVESIDKLYYLEASIPKPDQIEKYIKLHKSSSIAEYFNKYGTKKGISRIKRKLSEQQEKIPLYDIYSENLYIVNKFNVYNRVVYQHYRFPTKNFLDKLKAEKKEKKQNKSTIKDVLEKRKYRKLSLLITFLQSFNLSVLYNTYITVFYLYANEVGKNITTCKRPSFLPHFTHIPPYYSRSEVINLALNMGVTLKEEKFYDPEDVNKLCNVISANDISADTLLKHQRYIIENNKVGLVQYYTLQGSYFINQYLRNLTSYEYRNYFLESLITPMWELLNFAPAFDKTYTLYRFVSNDSYLKHLSIGDIYTEQGFTSTTRDPFYRSDLYKFGFILIKINIPGNQPGVALCIETISHFPKEEEIILSPLSMFRLDKKDDKIQYYHTDENFRSQVKTRYEFTYIGKKPVSYVDRLVYESDIKVDFMKIENVETITLEEKIRFFIGKYANPMFQFSTAIGQTYFTVIAERYDSTGAYSNFYGGVNDNGFLLYTVHDDYILFMIELGEDQSKLNSRYMYVNYYVKYSMLDRNKIIGDENFIKFVSSIALYFGIDKAIIWADYTACESTNPNILTGGAVIQRGFTNKIYLQKPLDKFKTEQVVTPGKYLGGSYCKDFYLYLKDGTKRYTGSNILNVELQPKFSYHQFDKLFKTDNTLILKKDDQDEVYQIYEKVYKLEKRSHNMADFYIWLSETKCYLLDTLVAKMERLFSVDNPFANDYYVLDPITFLYNRKYIQTYPHFLVHSSTAILKDSKNIMPKNEYRLRTRKSFNQ